MENAALVRAVRARVHNWRPGDAQGLVTMKHRRRGRRPGVLVVEGLGDRPVWIDESLRFVQSGEVPDWLFEQERFEFVEVDDSRLLVLAEGIPSRFVEER